MKRGKPANFDDFQRPGTNGFAKFSFRFAKMSIEFIVRDKNGSLWSQSSKDNIYEELLRRCLTNELIDSQEFPDARRAIMRFIAGPVKNTHFETTETDIRLVSTQKKCRATIILAFFGKNIQAHNRKTVMQGFQKLAQGLDDMSSDAPMPGVGSASLYPQLSSSALRMSSVSRASTQIL
jgi:hypothetical protein